MGGFKILAVDDDPITRERIETSLKLEGYQVMLAANTSEALAALQNDNFDLVITDLQMGYPDGFEVIKKAKELNPLTQGILITGNPDVCSTLKSIRIGVEDYFLKPFSLRDLLDSVQKCVDKLEIKQ